MSEMVSNVSLAFDPSAHNPNGTSPEEIVRIVQAVRHLNRTEYQSSDQGGNFLKFAYDEKNHRPIVRVVNRSTGEVIYQIPPDEVLRMSADVRKKARTVVEAASGESSGGGLVA